MSVFPWREAPSADFAVIGDPVTHSLSPRMHSAALEHMGLPWRYVAIHVPRGEVNDALDHLARLGYRGVNVTVPHKEAALRWATAPDEVALRVGAANTLRFSDQSAINTDIPGLRDTLEELTLPNRKVLLLGAGGSARAALEALQGWEVAVWNRTRANAEALGSGFDLLENPVVEGAGLVLNTTSASLSGSVIPVGWEALASGAVAYDLMYSRGPTPFLAEAASHGLTTLDGKGLLVAQGAWSLEYWVGQPAPRDVMRRSIEAVP